MNHPLSGVIPIDKALGMTSHDVVARVRRAFLPEKIKVGHAGTLDPDATGVLLVCIGSATRLADLLVEQGKEYVAEFVLGIATDSEDASGAVTATCDASGITQEQVEAVLLALTGDIQQVPPMVSAVHHQGQRLYELARKGLVVEREARTIHVENIELLEFTPGTEARGRMRVVCGKGTYVRTLCADLGAQLQVGGHMAVLRRTRVGVFQVDSASQLDDLDAASITERLVSANDAVAFLPERMLSDAEVVDVLHGRSVDSSTGMESVVDGQFIRLIDSERQLIALAEIDSAGRLAPKKVLAGAAS